MAHADSYFSIGHAHEICQDYAAHSDTEPFAVLSDGCSGAPMTDWGSRLIVHNSMRHGAAASGGQLALLHAKWKAKACEIPMESLYCTRGWVRVKGGFVRYDIEGDGYIIAKRKDGAVEVTQVEYPDGAPWYPMYEHLGIDSSGLMCEITSLTNEEVIDYAWLEVDQCPLEMILVCSDGLGTFVDTENRLEKVDPVALANDICDVKIPTGAFLRRRVRSLKKRKWKHFRHEDDLSIVGIWLGDAQ